ncbi:MAG TPA: tetratricopeptide repeat protein [Anaerolineae bacterium]|nr:tetratricopeptide repeat protein [Anaerolineae bacterium]
MTPPNEIPQQTLRATDDTALAETLYEQGMAYYQRREWRQALDHFQRLKAIEPNWPGLDPLIDEASWLLQLEQVEARSGQALEEDGVERWRRPTGALRWVAALLVVGAALAALAWWQGWFPGVGDRLEYEALYNRGQSSLAVGDYQGAKEAFAGLARLAPERFVALAQEGLERAARLEQVALAYEEANAAILVEDWDTAEAQLRSVLAVDPIYADASERLEYVLRQRETSTLFRAGVAAYDDGNSSLAIEQLERLSELDATYQRDAVRELLFVLYLRDGRALLAIPDANADGIRQALARFGKALALRPRNVEAAEERQLANRFLTVRTALDREDLDQAEAALADLLVQQPDYAGGQAAELYYQMLLRRGDAARTAGDEAAANLAYQKALALDVQDLSHARSALQQLQPTATPTPVIQAAPTPFIQVQTDSLNVRLGPGTDYPIVGQLSAGGQLALLGRNEAGDWLVVCCVDDRPGWVATRLVSTEIDIMDLPIGLPPARVPVATPTAFVQPTTTRTPTPIPTPQSASTPTSPPAPTEPPPAPTEPPPTPTPPPR